jgi:hypothetical protein
MLSSSTQAHHWKYLFYLPLIAILTGTFSFCTGPVKSGVTPDPEYVIDTIIVFDPVTYKEEMTIFRVPVSMANEFENVTRGPAKGCKADTVVVYDKDTHEKVVTRITVTGFYNKKQ